MLHRWSHGLRTHAFPQSRCLSSFRSHTCGDLRLEHHAEQRVTLSGWIDAIRPFGPISFISLRDRHGITQLVVEKNQLAPSAAETFAKLRPESVIQATGVVRARPENMRNENMKTGDVEVLVDELLELNACAHPLPLQVAMGSEVANEETRLKYRYLDLRRPLLQQNLVVRSEIALATRNYLCAQGFVEIETPTLFKSTPEGAREFLVPTRTKSQFYALTQSPQQYKQLLMVGGLDRYFQLARCYRDEGGRADRQPEFTQIDLELSFVKQNDILQLIEGLVKTIWQTAGCALSSANFPRMSFQEAMDRFGVDKPDTRYGLELQTVTNVLENSVFPLFQAALTKKNGTIRAINCKQLGLNGFSRKEIDGLVQVAKQFAPSSTLLVVKVEGPARVWKSSLTKQLTAEEITALNDQLDVEDGDVLLLSAGSYDKVTTLLGRMRTHTAQLLYAKGFLQQELDPKNFHHVWILDFPMFERHEDQESEDEAVLSATHHPFTAPADEDSDKFQSLLAATKDKNVLQDPAIVDQLLKLKAQHFDIVCNGWELGGGSIRIHNATLQQQVFEDVLRLPPLQRASFEHLLQALRHGAPPHGGIALGLDRLVAILCGAPSLRDVIAFPKSSTGNELMTNAPGPVTPSQLAEYHIQVTTDDAFNQAK